MVQAITSIEKCNQRNIEVNEINNKNLKIRHDNIIKINNECQTNKKSLEKNIDDLRKEFIRSSNIADKRGSTQAQKNKKNTDKYNLDLKISELKDYNTNCKNRINQENTSYNNNLLPRNWGRNLDFKVWAGMPFEQTNHICCPLTHREIGHMKYGQLDDYHVCYKN